MNERGKVLRCLTTGIAALLLTTWAARAGDDYEDYVASARARGDMTDKFYLHLHACNIVLRTDLGVDTLELADLVALQRLIPTLRACDGFYKCVAKRDWHRYTPDA